MTIKKGIILAGGTGSRLYPLTLVTNKQLLPIYDKPAIYYPLTTLMLAGIQKIQIITTPKDIHSLKLLLGSGEQFGLELSYQIQENPNGLPEAFILSEKFIDDDPVAMILGDNFFHGHGLSESVLSAAKLSTGAHIFACRVDDPERYGIVELDNNEHLLSFEEKPIRPKSDLAVTGLYYFDGSVSGRSKALKPSTRGELEIIDLIKSYVADSTVEVTQFGRGYVWFDTGTPQSLLDTSRYVELIQNRQGTIIASPEEVALYMNLIDKNQFEKNVLNMPSSKYKDRLVKMAK